MNLLAIAQVYPIVNLYEDLFQKTEKDRSIPRESFQLAFEMTGFYNPFQYFPFSPDIR